MSTTKTKPLICNHHAIDRFMERSGEKDIEKAMKAVFRIAEKGRPVKMIGKRAVLAIINNNFEVAEYRCYGSWIAVIVDNTIKTVFERERGMFVDL